MKSTKKKVTKRRAGGPPVVGRLNRMELDAMMRELRKNAPKIKFKRGPNGIEVRPEDTASGRGLISFRVFPKP